MLDRSQNIYSLDNSIKQPSFYDVIVIGSGIGGLTAASILTQLYGLKVLVLEQHYTLGGLTHTFKRPPGYEWSVGVHYVGRMNKGNLERDIFDTVTGKGVEWSSMPSAYDNFCYPDMLISANTDLLVYKENLIKRFPTEKKAIEKYFKDIKTVCLYAKGQLVLSNLDNKFSLPGKLINFFSPKSYRITLLEYLNQNISSPKLKAVLASQWGDYGILPEFAPFALHALIVEHYLNGASYPKNGSARIAKSIQSVIEANGGLCLRNARVIKMTCSDGIVNSITFSKNNNVYEVRSDAIISNIGLYETNELLDNIIPKIECAKFYQNALSSFTLYLGFNENPKNFGLYGNNYWMFRDYDLSYNFNRENVPVCFLSAPPDQTEYFTAQITTFCSYDTFAAFESSNWRKRPEEYLLLKDKLADQIWSLVERYFPDLKRRVIYQEASTPLTIKHFTHSYKGTIYGAPHYKKISYHKHYLEKNIKNLALSGTDAAFPGVVGAMFGGLVAVSRITKEPFYKVLKRIKKRR